MRTLTLFVAVVMVGAMIAQAVGAAGVKASSAFCLGMFWMIAVSLVINSLPARRA